MTESKLKAGNSQLTFIHESITRTRLSLQFIGKKKCPPALSCPRPAARCNSEGGASKPMQRTDDARANRAKRFLSALAYIRMMCE